MTKALIIGSLLAVISMNNIAFAKQSITAKNTLLATRICLNAAKNELSDLKANSYRLHKGKANAARMVANSITCNGEKLNLFAAKYNAYDVVQYLNRYITQDKHMQVKIEDVVI